MNTAILTPSFFPIRGGTEQIVYEVAKRTARQHNSVVITPRRKSTKWFEVLDGINVYRFPFIELPMINVLSSQLVLLFFLPYILHKEQVKVLQMNHVYMLGGAAVFTKWLLRMPLITYLSGWDTYDPLRPVPRLLWPYLAWIMNRSNALLCPSTSMAKNAKKQGARNKIHIIPHGSNMTRLILSELDLRKKYSLGENEKIVFSLQRLEPRKGLQYLIKAIPLVLEKRQDVKFIIGGKGSQREKLEQLAKQLGIQDFVIFAGFIPDNLLKTYYAQADLFTLPSLYEGFGIVYVDALLNGVPIVATRCGGPEDIVTEKNGLLIPTRDSVALAEALLIALDKEWDKEKIKQEAARYDWDNIYESYAGVYRRLLAKDGNQGKTTRKLTKNGAHNETYS